MSRIIGFCIFLAVSCSFNLQAYAYNLGNNEFINNLGVEHALSDNAGIRGSYTHFYVPNAKNHIHFIYLGPTFSISDILWFSPQAGLAGNWVPDHDAYFASLWINLSLFQGALTVFNEADAVFYNGDLQDYYGFTSINYNYSSYHFGLQYEQVNKNFKTGPHIGFTKGVMSIEVQIYLISNNLDEFNLRIVTGLSF